MPLNNTPEPLDVSNDAHYDLNNLPANELVISRVSKGDTVVTVLHLLDNISSGTLEVKSISMCSGY